MEKKASDQIEAQIYTRGQINSSKHYLEMLSGHQICHEHEARPAALNTQDRTAGQSPF